MNSKDKNKTWLILAHCFNMDGRAASQTITDRIPFLMEKGIKPVVISAPTGTRDTRFIHYQILSPAPSGIHFEVRKIIERKFGKTSLSRLLKAITTILCLPFLIVEKIFINLDSHWSWFITASLKGAFAVKKYEPEVIYSTAGPSSTHLTGYLLKRIFQRCWIAEIHDPLIHENGKKRYQRYSFHKWLERAIFINADAVIYFTENACENARQRTGIYQNSHVLKPGANPPQASCITYKKLDKVHFGHFGALDSERNLYLFFEALSRVLVREPSLREKIAVDVYGMALDPISKKAVRMYSLEDIVHEHGRLEYDPETGKSGRQQVVEKMHQCDILILIHGNDNIMEEYIPSKLYEYLLARRPIMAITSQNSELARLLRTRGHFILDQKQLNELINFIGKYILLWEAGGIPSVESGEDFTVPQAVQELMSIVSSTR